MKKFITLLLIVATGLPYVSFAANDSLTISQYPRDVLVLQDVNLHVSGPVNLSRANITWYVEGEEKLTQYGATNYTMRLGPSSDPVTINVRAFLHDGTTIDWSYEVQPRSIGTAPLSRFRAVAISTGKDIIMRINPPGPRGFDKVTAELTSQKSDILVLLADPETKVDWYTYGDATSTYTGTKYTFRLGPSTLAVPIEARVTKLNEGSGAYDTLYSIKYKFIPFDDGMINPPDNLSRAMSCTADALDQAANNVDRLQFMINDSIAQIDALTFQLDENIEIIATAVEGLQRSFAADTAELAALYKQFPKDYTDISADLRWGANMARLALKLKDGGSTARSIVRIQKAIDFITHFQDILNQLKDQKQREILSMQGQFDRQAQRCSKAYQKINTHGL